MAELKDECNVLSERVRAAAHFEEEKERFEKQGACALVFCSLGRLGTVRYSSIRLSPSC